MKKKRIALFVTTTPECGGSFQYAIAMLDALSILAQREYDVRVWARSRLLRKYIRAKGLPVSPIPRFFHGTIQKFLTIIPFSCLRKQLLSIWNAFEPCSFLAKLWKADMVIIPDQSYRLLPKGVLQLACIHDLMHRYESDFPEVSAFGESIRREALYEGIIQYCHAIFVDSETGKEHVVNSYKADPSKLFVLPYIVYNGLKSAIPARPSGLPQELEAGYLFYPAQFWLHKNHQNLVAAVARLATTLNIHCVFSGDIHKNGYAPLRKRIVQLGLQDRVHCIGYVSEGELAWLYQHARCMIMPTFFGPTNIPPLEAMHFGCPVGVSNIYAMPEQLGDAPLYFNPDSVDEIAHVIKQLWSNETILGRCIQKGFAVAEEHSERQFSYKVEQIIKTVFTSNSV